MYKNIIFFFAIIGLTNTLFAQDDLLEELEAEAPEQTFESPAFKAFKIGNLQSTKVADKGDTYMYVSHRFGSLKKGVNTFYGLDEANTKIQMIYGLFDGFQLGLSRESLRKTYAGSVKWRWMAQGETFPVNVVAYSTVNVNTQLSTKQYPKLRYRDRYSYATQLLISRRITNGISLQLAPSYVRQNLVLESFQKHDQMVLGVGGRFKMSKRTSINIDYAYNFSRHKNSIYKDPLTIGLDIETGGHIFQLLFSNAQSTNEPGFLSNAEGDWSKREIFFGFNIVRVF
ncbi:MAG: DUF5777 family beta-barrel protein [Flavobacteriales bacterium]